MGVNQAGCNDMPPRRFDHFCRRCSANTGPDFLSTAHRGDCVTRAGDPAVLDDSQFCESFSPHRVAARGRCNHLAALNQKIYRGLTRHWASLLTQPVFQNLLRFESLQLQIPLCHIHQGLLRN